MANYDDNAFNSMNNSAGGDMYVTGGAITMSEYEQNMNPNEQSKYEGALMERFKMAYTRDPYKQNLDFKHWLGSLNPDLYRERAQKYEDIQAENNGYGSIRRGSYTRCWHSTEASSFAYR